MERWPKIDFGLSPKAKGGKGSAASSAFEGETAKIKDMFSNAQKQVNRIGLVRSRMAKRPQADRLICNAQESMKSKLCVAGELFSALQQAYLEQLEKNKEFVAKRVSKAPTVIVPPTQQSNQKVPVTDEYIEMPLSPNGQSQMLLSRQTPTYSILDERQEEITRIWSNCMEVFEILRYMQALIEKQGDQLDRIDTNMDEAMMWVERAKGRIEVVRRDQDVALKRNMIVLSLVSAIFIMLLIIIFR